MEYAHSVVLALVITVSLAGMAMLYIGEHIQSMDDEYQVIAHAKIVGSGNGGDSSGNGGGDSMPKLQIVTVAYTNAGNRPIQMFEASITGCTSCNHTERTTTQAHASETVLWPVKNNEVRGKVIDMHFTFDDATVVIKTQRLQ